MKKTISKILAIVMIVTFVGGVATACRKKDYTEVKKIRKKYDDMLEDYEDEQDPSFTDIMDDMLKDNKKDDSDITLELAYRAKKICGLAITCDLANLETNIDYMEDNEKELSKLMGNDEYDEALDAMDEALDALPQY